MIAAPGLADQAREGSAEREPDPAAVVPAEERHQAEEADSRGRAGTGARREARSARECSPPTARSASGSTYAALTEHVAERVREPGADRATVEAQVEDRAEHEPERAQREPEKLVLAMRASARFAAS